MTPQLRDAAWAFVRQSATKQTLNSDLLDSMKEATGFIAGGGLFQALATLYEREGESRTLAEALSDFLFGGQGGYASAATRLRYEYHDVQDLTEQAQGWLDWALLFAGAMQV